MYEILLKILDIPSISGNEHNFTKEWHSITKGLCEESYIDKSGNWIGIINKNGKKSILINSHSDEIGLITTKIDEKGTVRFKAIGTGDASILYGQRVIFPNSNIMGLIQSAKKLGKEDSKLKIEDLMIDIGSCTKEETLKHIRIGDYIHLHSVPRKLLNNTLMGKGLDDKAGLAVMYYLMKNLNKNLIKDLKIIFTATVREEINSFGAITLASRLKPDYSLSIDVAETNDLQTDKNNECELFLDKGPIILKCPVLDESLQNLMVKSAEETEIKIQYEASPHLSYTDADEIHKLIHGIPSNVVSIPIRYIHTSNEMISLNDLENTAKLTEKFLEELSKSCI